MTEKKNTEKKNKEVAEAPKQEATKKSIKKTGLSSLAAKEKATKSKSPKKPKTGKSEKVSKTACGDAKCPIHGKLRTRGRIFEGVVVSDKMQRAVTIEWLRRVKVQKYERYLTRKSRLKAHNPPCISAKKGDFVRVAECRPISKTISSVVVEILSSSSKSKKK